MQSNNVACAAANTHDENNTSEEDLAAMDGKKCRVGVMKVMHTLLLHQGYQ